MIFFFQLKKENATLVTDKQFFESIKSGFPKNRKAIKTGLEIIIRLDSPWPG